MVICAADVTNINTTSIITIKYRSSSAVQFNCFNSCNSLHMRLIQMIICRRRQSLIELTRHYTQANRFAIRSVIAIESTVAHSERSGHLVVEFLYKDLFSLGDAKSLSCVYRSLFITSTELPSVGDDEFDSSCCSLNIFHATRIVFCCTLYFTWAYCATTPLYANNKNS